MSEISPNTFFAFRGPEWKEVKLMLRSHEGLSQVKNALIDFLAEWNGREWVDWEKIDLILRDLEQMSFWRMLPYGKFLDEAKSKVSDEIIEGLRKYHY